ncbi:Pycsar system effector family protein [Actinoplanes couchii]|uniref:Pycsar system effector family protein n=1 Tax=Actinoplanes couchii TaxID=403638 RepID=UPI001EF2FEE7|nr:Pycsar system effector family protein [Actinoplanes couchii]
MFRRRHAQVPPPPPEPDATPEDAWRTLLLVVEWIKHAESKAAATLAAAGVAGGLLYSLVNTATPRGPVLVVVASLCAATITVVAVAASMALVPRRRSGRDPGGLIFYQGIADRFGTDAPGFTRAYTDLVTDRPAFLHALTRQIWANANVAARKYRALNVGVLSLVPAFLLLAATALITLLSR